MKVEKRKAKRITVNQRQSIPPRQDILLDTEALQRRRKQEEKLLKTVAEIILNIIMKEEK